MSNLTCVLNGLTWEWCERQVLWKFCNICRKMSVRKFTERSYIICIVSISLKKALRQIWLFRNLRKYKSGMLVNVIKEGIINFESYFFSVDVKLLSARMLDSKLVFCMFYVTVHRFLARVQSPTCTTYEKFLLESIMVVLTPKFGIMLSEFLESRIVPLNSSLTSKEVGHRNWKIYLKASVKLIAIYVQTTDCWKKKLN